MANNNWYNTPSWMIPNYATQWGQNPNYNNQYNSMPMPGSYDYDYLAHHGIKGMRWGVRKDRGRVSSGFRLRSRKTPTPQFAYAGNEAAYTTAEKTTKPAKNYEVARYNGYTAMAKASSTAINSLKNSTEKRQKEKYDRKLADAKKAIDLSNVPDDELRKAVNRMNLEKQYRDLKTAPEVKMGKSKALTFLEYAGDIVAIAGGITTIIATTKAMKNMK